MESLRVEKKDIYRIEVNDNGEYIEFDLNDIGGKVRCYEALDKIENLSKEYEEKFNQCENATQQAYLEQEMFIKMREAMDLFLGEGACQKIFGDRNYYEMFNDLLDELSKKRPELNNKSHLDMLNFNAENIRNRIINKYNKNTKKVI